MLQIGEKQLLRTLLAKAPPGEVSFNYHELQGFLFGVAITPDYILPSDWLPIVFRSALGLLPQVEELMTTVTRICYRLCAAFQDRQLTFPYDTKGLSRREEEMLHQWLCGLEEALNLREELWNPAAFPDLPKERREALYSAILNIQGLTTPEDTYAFFGTPVPGQEIRPKPGEEPGLTPEEVKAMLLSGLPRAMDTLQRHAYGLEKKRQSGTTAVVHIPFPDRIRRKEVSAATGGRLVHVDFRNRRRLR